jgi:dephospho-CoA kinase
MLKIGLTGGLGCGKSFVGDALESYGCLLIRADELGHQVLARGGEAYDEIVREFRGIVREDGEIDRRALAAQVFADPERLARLNAIVHPRVMRREEELLSEFAAREPHGIGVVEAAILIETGSFRRYDRLIVVSCTEQQQLERTIHRSGASEQDVRARLSRQLPLSEKLKFADFVIDTSGDKEDTLRQTRAVYEALRRIEL